MQVQDPTPPWRVLVVDDHVVLADALSLVLGADVRYGEVRVAHSVAEAEDLIGQQPFDRAIIDVRLPDGDGTTLVHAVREASPVARVVVLTATPHPLVVARGLEGGARAVLPKGTDLAELLAVLEDDLGPRGSGRGERSGLTAREIDVLSGLARGSDVRGVARELEISSYTVRDHLKSVHAKLNVSSQLGAVLAAHRAGYIDLDEQGVRGDLADQRDEAAS